jgi:hypothetical protein
MSSLTAVRSVDNTAVRSSTLEEWGEGIIEDQPWKVKEK